MKSAAQGSSTQRMVATPKPTLDVFHVPRQQMPTEDVAFKTEILPQAYFEMLRNSDTWDWTKHVISFPTASSDSEDGD